MTQIDLASAKAKLRHAETHIATCRTLIDTMMSQEKNQLGISAELAADGLYGIRVTSMPDLAPIAQEVSLIVGDIVHNLRSALDHLAWQLACDAAGGTPAKPKKVHFPICDPPQPGKTCKTPQFFEANDWRKIHEFEPCRGLNNRPDGWAASYIHQLKMLQDLSNADKHHTLHLVLLTTHGMRTIETRT